MPKRPGLALLAIAGVSLEPIEYAIGSHDPEIVVLIASDVTRATAEQALARFQRRGRIALVQDAESIASAFSTARDEIARLLGSEIAAIVIDITGGTKAMTAGVTLACSGHGATFSYVGGTERDALGRVTSGAERLRVIEDPAPSDRALEQRLFRQAWNDHRFAFAASIAEQTARGLARPSLRAFYAAVARVCTGLDAWDRFRYADARSILRSSLPTAREVAAELRHGEKERVLRALQTHLTTLDALAGGERNAAWVADVMRNAACRQAHGRVDDACLRLLRVARRVTGPMAPDTHRLTPDGVDQQSSALTSADTGTSDQALASERASALSAWIETTSERLAGESLEPLEASVASRGLELLAALGHHPSPSWPRW